MQLILDKIILVKIMQNYGNKIEATCKNVPLKTASFKTCFYFGNTAIHSLLSVVTVTMEVTCKSEVCVKLFSLKCTSQVPLVAYLPLLLQQQLAFLVTGM